MATLRKILRTVFSVPLAIVLLFEEWGWEPLAALMGRLARWSVWAALERWIAGLPRWSALLMFGAPMVALLPVKLAALYLFGHGRVTLGLTLLIGAKLAGTAVLARLFQLTEPALMQFAWFARWYPRWKAWKNQLLTWVRSTPAWLLVGQVRRKVRRWRENVTSRFRS